MFSATMPGELKDIVHNYMSKNLLSISVDMETLGLKESIISIL